MLLKSWFDQHPSVEKANVFYDIACVFSKYLEKNDKSLLEKLNLAIPVFHCYGHKALCQVTYSPRRVANFGRTDGEAMERLWSYARPFNTITKEMTGAHRQDLLTDVFLHYARKKKTNIAHTLRKRYIAAQKEASNCQEQLDKMQKEFPVTEEILKEWEKREKSFLVQEKDANKISEKPQCWQEEYVILLQKLAVLRSQMIVSLDSPATDIVDQIKELDIKLADIERRKSITKRWQDSDELFQTHHQAIQLRHKEKLLRQMLLHARERLFLSTLIKKYSAGGQTMATRLSRQINLASKKITKLVKVYNGASFSSGSLPATVTQADVLNPTSHVYSLVSTIQESIAGSAVSSTSIMREMLDLHQRNQRTTEELHLLKEEMRNVCNYYVLQIEFVKQTLEDEIDSGKRAMMAKYYLELKQGYAIAMEEFHPVYVGSPQDPVAIDHMPTGTLVPASEEEVELLESYFNDSSDESGSED